MTGTILVGDFGGTHITIHVCSTPPFTTQHTYEYKTKDVKSALPLVKKLSSRHPTITEACFAVAGPVSDNSVKMTNSDLQLDARSLVAETDIDAAIVLNDFEALGYGVNIEDQATYVVQQGQAKKTHTKALIGAGTGLGKAILYYDHRTDSYTPLPSEGGHSDIPIQPEEEHLVQHISNQVGRARLRYEDIVSGPGLKRIYNALKDVYAGPNNVTTTEISEQRHTNARAREAMNLFTRFYARAARNFALDTYAKGGIYIAGGIAPKNMDIFKDFRSEFTNHPTHKNMLETIPITVMKDYTISLRGAAYALKHRKNRCITKEDI